MFSRSAHLISSSSSRLIVLLSKSQEMGKSASSSHKTGPSVVLFFIFMCLFHPTPEGNELPVVRDKPHFLEAGTNLTFAFILKNMTGRLTDYQNTRHSFSVNKRWPLVCRRAAERKSVEESAQEHIFVTYSIDTEIKTAVKRRHDVEMTVFRSVSGLFLQRTTCLPCSKEPRL